MVDSDNEIVHDIIVRDLEICNQTAGKYFSHLVFSEQEIEKNLVYRRYYIPCHHFRLRV